MALHQTPKHSVMMGATVRVTRPAPSGQSTAWWWALQWGCSVLHNQAKAHDDGHYSEGDLYCIIKLKHSTMMGTTARVTCPASSGQWPEAWCWALQGGWPVLHHQAKAQRVDGHYNEGDLSCTIRLKNCVMMGATVRVTCPAPSGRRTAWWWALQWGWPVLHHQANQSNRSRETRGGTSPTSKLMSGMRTSPLGVTRGTLSNLQHRVGTVLSVW